MIVRFSLAFCGAVATFSAARRASGRADTGAGDIVILDNLSSHKVAGVREAIEARSASLVHLLPYSPDLNPIAQAFAKLNALLRKIAAPNHLRTMDAFRRILGRLTSQDCPNYLGNAENVPLERKPF